MSQAAISVAALIHRARERKALSARQLSSKAGLSPSYVTKLESGELEPSLRAFSALADVLDLTIEEIALCVWAARGQDA